MAIFHLVHLLTKGVCVTSILTGYGAFSVTQSITVLNAVINASLKSGVILLLVEKFSFFGNFWGLLVSLLKRISFLCEKVAKVL